MKKNIIKLHYLLIDNKQKLNLLCKIVDLIDELADRKLNPLISLDYNKFINLKIYPKKHRVHKYLSSLLLSGKHK